MNRFLLWGSVAATACLCCFSLGNLSLSFNEYRSLRDDITRQLDLISELSAALSGQTEKSEILSSLETVNQFSEQTTEWNLIEQRMLSEKIGDVLSDWEEWRIEAVCSGSLSDIYGFIELLETNAAYHALNFTVDATSAGIYDLNIDILFYARHE